MTLVRGSSVVCHVVVPSVVYMYMNRILMAHTE